MQSTAINLEFKLNVNLRLVKPHFMQSMAVNLEFKLKVIFKLLSRNRPLMFNKNAWVQQWPCLYDNIQVSIYFDKIKNKLTLKLKQAAPHTLSSLGWLSF